MSQKAFDQIVSVLQPEQEEAKFGRSSHFEFAQEAFKNDYFENGEKQVEEEMKNDTKFEDNIDVSTLF